MIVDVWLQTTGVTAGGEPGDPVVHNPAQPTRYHYYPHNQHVYLLPECAIQQVIHHYKN
jgi:hypothetical protein